MADSQTRLCFRIVAQTSAGEWARQAVGVLLTAPAELVGLGGLLR